MIQGLYSLKCKKCKSRGGEIRYYYNRIALQFVRHLGSADADVPVKFQGVWKTIIPNPAASRDLAVRRPWLEALMYSTQPVYLYKRDIKYFYVLACVDRNIVRHTLHTIVLWPNQKHFFRFCTTKSAKVPFSNYASSVRGQISRYHISLCLQIVFTQRWH